MLFLLNKKAPMCSTEGRFGTFEQSCVSLGSSSHLGKTCPMWVGTSQGHCHAPTRSRDFNSREGWSYVPLNYGRSCCVKCAITAHSAAPAMREASKSWALHKWPEVLPPCPRSPVWQRAVKFSIIQQVFFHYQLSVHKWTLQYRMNSQYSMGFLLYSL